MTMVCSAYVDSINTGLKICGKKFQKVPKRKIFNLLQLATIYMAFPLSLVL